MRFSIITFLLLFLSINILAQSNENKAKSEFFAAQEAYDYANYKKCVNHLNTTENLLGSTNPRILHLKIKAYCNLKEYSKAYETQKIFFEKATDPNDPKYNDILKLLAEINKNAANDFVEVGKTYIDKKYYTQAINEFNKALEIDPKNISAHFNLGTAFLNTNEYDKAILSYSKARTLSSSIEDKNSRLGWLFSIAYNKGIAYENLGKYDLAIASYENALKTKPEKSSTYIMLAIIYAKQNNTAQSLEYLEKAIKKGFNDFAYIEKDPDMTNIINTNEYKKLKTYIFDKRDGQSYKTVAIGNQVWMAENLNFITDNSFCYDNLPANCNTYGRLYTCEAAKNACPDGWHLPSDEEWKVLERFLGMSERQARIHYWRGTNEGNKLKSTNGWYDNGNGDNTSGFSAIPSGFFANNENIFSNLTKEAYWWSSTRSRFKDEYTFYNRALTFNSNLVYREVGSCINFGLNVRCIKDN